MKNQIVLNYCILIFMTIALSNSVCAVENILQDIEVYPLNGQYYARGKINQETMFQSKSADQAIQFAINQFDSIGGEVTLYRGEYYIDKPLMLKNQIHLRGSGRASRLIVTQKNENGIGILCRDKRGITISNICVIAQDNKNAKTGIILDGCGDSKIKDCFVVGFSEYGIWKRNNSYLCHISDCSLAGNGKANIYLDKLKKDGKYGDYMPNLITNCMIYRGGVGIEANNSIVAHIIGCMIVQSKGAGIYLHHISNSILISGVRTYQITGHGVVVEDTDEFNLTGNIISWHTKHGVLIKNSRWGTITGNEIIDNGSYNTGTKNTKTKENVDAATNDTIPLYCGISLHKVRGYSISGNSVFNWPVCMPMSYGIYEDSLSFKNTITSNHVNFTKKEGILSKGVETVVSDNAVFEDGPMRSDNKMYYDKKFNTWLSQSFQPELLDLFIEIQK